MNDVRLKLSPPWIIYVNYIMAMFGKDPDIGVTYDNDEHEIKLYVEKPEKATALSILLPTVKTIGNIALKVTIIPANNKQVKAEELGKLSNKQIFDMAFDGNPVYKYAEEITGIFSNVLTYVVFKKEVVQMFADNLNDFHGVISTLYQDVAKELFDESGLESVFYNTDVTDELAAKNWL